MVPPLESVTRAPEGRARRHGEGPVSMSKRKKTSPDAREGRCVAARTWSTSSSLLSVQLELYWGGPSSPSLPGCYFSVKMRKKMYVTGASPQASPGDVEAD